MDFFQGITLVYNTTIRYTDKVEDASKNTNIPPSYAFDVDLFRSFTNNLQKKM